ncbi:hypothetical protein DFH28DRAFT_968230 [Melampsora americana]|nr:hypothetical protein DFH28DRAFT_968230 [Melampsora americana]
MYNRSPPVFEEDARSMSTSPSSASSNPTNQDTPSMTTSLINSPPCPRLWSEKEVKKWLEAVGFSEVASVSEGRMELMEPVLVNLDSESLRDLGMAKVGRRLKLIRLINELTSGVNLSVLSHEELITPYGSGKVDLESHVLSTFNNQDERISHLEEELWELRAFTRILRERSSSIASFNSSWATHTSCKDQDALSILHASPADLPPVLIFQSSPNTVGQNLDTPHNEFDLCSPSCLIPNPTSLSSHNSLTPKSYQFPSNTQNPSSTSLSSNTKNPCATANTNRQSSTYGLLELRRKFSYSKLEAASMSSPNLTASTPKATTGLGASQSGLMVARKPSLLTRPTRSPMLYTSTLPSSDMNMTEDLRYSTEARSRAHDKLSGMSRSASTSNLRTAQSLVESKPPLNSETSIRVKSNNEETVIEVLINHLSSFYLDDPYAWSKHVLIVRKKGTTFTENSLSYDQIPLKVYRSFKSREGVDFAIRSIDELPSPLRSIKACRKRENRSISTDQFIAGDTDEGNESSDTLRQPHPHGLAICGYQSDLVDEISIKPGQTFIIRDSVTSSIASISPSPTRTFNHNTDSIGWAPKNCILETTRSICSFAPNGVTSLKNLISNPIDTMEDIFDKTRLTTAKICLISFQSLSHHWSGELLHLRQGEILRAFDSKTHSHWTYCLRESTGERGWCPNWILSSNLQVFTQGVIKLRNYLHNQQSPHGSLRSASLRSPRPQPIAVTRLAGRSQQSNEEVTSALGTPPIAIRKRTKHHTFDE